MEAAGANQKQNKHVIIVETFPVPKTLEQIRKNITITTNKISNTSKEKIINQAFR